MNILESLNRGLEQTYHLTEAKEDKECFKAFINDDALYNRFELLKSKQIIKGQESDYTYWEKQSVNALRDFIEKTEKEQENKKAKKQAISKDYKELDKMTANLQEGKDYKIIYQGNGWTICHILTYEASASFGKDTKWCISGLYPGDEGPEKGRRYFSQYRNKGANYYFLIPEKNPETNTWCYLYYNKELKASDKYFFNSKDIPHIIETVNIPADVLSNLPGVQQKLIDYVKEAQEITAEVQITGVYTYNPLYNASFIARLNPKKIVVLDSVKEIAPSAFYGCDSFEEINIQDGVEKIGSKAFCVCNFLKEVILPNSIKEIGESAFSTCKSLQEIALPNSIKEIEKSTFMYCNSLKEVILPNNVEKIGKFAFYDCISLKEITIPNSIKEIGDGAFYYCKSLKEISLPNSINHIGGSAFYNCTSLQKINIPDGIKRIDEMTFDNCTSLQEVILPNSVKEICGHAFANCISLQEINIPNSIEKIEDFAFYFCTSLQEITLPDSVKEIWEKAFGYCISLPMINIKGKYRPKIFKKADLNDTVILNWIDCGIEETWEETKKQLNI